MKKTIKEADEKESPNFGSNDLEDINPTGDVKQDFNNAMVALRDDNYEAFVKDLNTLASDPKIEFLRDAIIDQFNSPSGVKVFFSKNQPLSIGSMHPTQHEVDMEKSLEFPLKTRPEMIDIAFSGKPISIKNLPLVVAEVDGTYYIIDGHHRWSQIYCMNPNAQMVVRVIKSDMFKNADDVLKLVQMQLFIAKNGGKLPQATVDSPYNLYTIDEKAFREWCQKTMIEEARYKFARYLKEDKDPIDHLWGNVVKMREYAEPTPNAHGRGDMPQTDKVEGEFMKPTAAPVSESKSKRGNTIMKRTRKTMESSKMHPELTCDRCGFKSSNEDYFTIAAGGDIVCRDCQYKFAMTNEAKEDNWFGIPDAKFISHGAWADPEVEYRGVTLNYWSIEEGLLEVYREDHPEDRNDKGFDKWMADHPEEIRSELELLYDAEMKYRDEHPEEFEDDDLEEYDESWIGDKAKAGWDKVKTGAKKVGKAIGDAFKGPFRKGDHVVLSGEDGEKFKGTIKSFDLGDKTYEVLLGNAVNESFDSEYDEEDEEWIAGVPDLGDAVYFQGCRIPKQDIYTELYNCGVDCCDDVEYDEYCKSNQKKVYGLLSDMCYAYPVSESFDDGVRGTQEQVLDMPDRAGELEMEIEKLWDRLGYLPGDKNEVVLDLISRYVELEQIEPGRVDF